MKRLYPCKIKRCSNRVIAVRLDTPPLSSIESALREGRSFSVGTGTVAATNQDFIKATFFNPSNSGVNAFIYWRTFSTNAANSFPELQFFGAPQELTTPIITPSNLKSGGVSSVIRFRSETNQISLGRETLSQVLPINGVSKDIAVWRLVQPGERFGYQITGSGGGIANPRRAAMTFVWFEEKV